MSSLSKLDRAAQLRAATNSSTRNLIDKSIRAVGNSILSDRRWRKSFYRVVRYLRAQTRLLDPTITSYPRGLQQVKQVLNVCQNVSRYSSRWVCEPESWVPDHGVHAQSLGEGLKSLVDHLYCKTQPYEYMYQCWFRHCHASNSRSQQLLFLHVGAGHSLRGTEYGKALSNKMISRLRTVPADTSFDGAIRFAQTGSPIKKPTVFPPGLSRRRKKRWGRKQVKGHWVSWNPIPVADFYCNEKVTNQNIGDRTWMIRQLTSRDELEREGQRLRHCVGGHWNDCQQGMTSIWTMESRDILRTRPLLTIEVLPKSRIIFEINGFANRKPRKNELRIIERWARQESLDLDDWKNYYRI